MSVTVPCGFCGKPTPMTGTKLCDPCWEVDRGIDTFARTERGAKRLLEALMTAGYTLIWEAPRG